MSAVAAREQPEWLDGANGLSMPQVHAPGVGKAKGPGEL